MILSGDTIKDMLRAGKLVKNGEYLVRFVGPNSLDVHLGRDFKRLCMPRGGVIDIHERQEYEDVPLDENGNFILKANGFVLATTEEYLTLPPEICALIDGRSTTGRMGLVVETAGMINGGFHGNITLEVKNLTNFPILMRPGDSVAQVRFEMLDRAPSNPYRGAYQGQVGTTTPRNYREVDGDQICFDMPES